eukprot:2168753-Prymnesium_polylepis.1
MAVRDGGASWRYWRCIVAVRRGVAVRTSTRLAAEKPRSNEAAMAPLVESISSARVVAEDLSWS